MSALGHKRTFTHLRSMSALPPKADILERDRHVCFVPKAAVSNRSKGSRLLDQFVGRCKQRGRHGEAERLHSFEIDNQLKLGRLLDGHVGRIGAL